MPWKASSVMEERLRFVARLLDGETMTDVCRDFGVSRKTGYKIFDRCKEHGFSALGDQSRRPVQVESLIVRLKAEKPQLGRAQASQALGPAARRRCQSTGQEHSSAVSSFLRSWRQFMVTSEIVECPSSACRAPIATSKLSAAPSSLIAVWARPLRRFCRNNTHARGFTCQIMIAAIRRLL